MKYNQKSHKYMENGIKKTVKPACSSLPPLPPVQISVLFMRIMLLV
jgi:hypothetical protein